MDKKNLALPAIMAVAAIIVVNAVVGQDGKHPAPMGIDEHHRKITRSKNPIINSKILRRKSSPAKIAAVAPRSRPKSVAPKVRRDGIGQLLQAAGRPGEKPAINTATAQEGRKIRFVQTRLGQLGYETGPVDGVMGQKTREAIRKFETDRKIPVSGEITGALMQALSQRASLASLDLT